MQRAEWVEKKKERVSTKLLNSDNKRKAFDALAFRAKAEGTAKKQTIKQ